jgi:hypothetical protein
MPTRQPRYSAEETARRGDAIYERDIRSHVEKTHRALLDGYDLTIQGPREGVWSSRPRDMAAWAERGAAHSVIGHARTCVQAHEV